MLCTYCILDYTIWYFFNFFGSKRSYLARGRVNLLPVVVLVSVPCINVDDWGVILGADAKVQGEDDEWMLQLEAGV